MQAVSRQGRQPMSSCTVDRCSCSNLGGDKACTFSHLTMFFIKQRRNMKIRSCTCKSRAQVCQKLQCRGQVR